MTTNLRPVLSATAAIAVGFALTACGGSTDDQPAAETTTVQTTESGTTESETTTSGTTTTSTSSATAGAGDTAGRVDPIAAIGTAESEVDGIAYEIDDADDDGSWEVTVRTGDTAREVTIGPDGAVVRVEDEQLDDDDRRALDAAQIGLGDAITTALNETGGILDDAEFEEDNGAFHIEVSVDATDRGDDVDVHIDPVSGDIVRID